MSPRANLPGADELFRRTQSAGQPAEPPGTGQPNAPTPGSTPAPAPAVAPAGRAPDPAAYLDSLAGEDAVLAAARRRAAEAGVAAVSPATGATLRVLATALGARTTVEIGTGVGVSGICLLRGMRTGGVLTTIDLEADRQRLARQAFTEAGFASSRTRLIAGAALQVLPRLSDGTYDLVFVDAVPADYAGYLDAALRLLRPGGLVAFDHALRPAAGQDSAQESDVRALRGLANAVRDDDRFTGALLPVGDGLLTAVKVAGL
jgi:predicted O-methyltransferase YrrM